MQQQVKVVGLSVVIIVVVLALIAFGRDGEAQKIHAQLDRLEELGSKEPGENQFETIGRARKLAAAFTEQPEVQLMSGVHHTGDRTELTGMMAGIRGRVSEADVSLGSRSVKVAEDGQSASVILVGSVTVNVNGQAERHRDKYLMEWKKVDGDWLISSVTLMGD